MTCLDVENPKITALGWYVRALLGVVLIYLLFACLHGEPRRRKAKMSLDLDNRFDGTGVCCWGVGGSGGRLTEV